MDPMLIQQLVQQAQMQGAPAGMAPPAGDPRIPVAQTTFPAQQSAMNPQYMQMMISLLNQKANGAPGLGQILGG